MSKRKVLVRSCIDCGCKIRTTWFRKPVDKTLCVSCSRKGDRNPAWKGGIAGKQKVRECVDCGCEVRSTGFRRSVKETRCTSCWQKGDRNVQWRGGCLTSKGYVLILKPGHPRARRCYVNRSHLVWEESNGRYVQPGEVIHHIDGSRDNDIIENLQIMTQGEHSSLHHRGRTDMAGKNNPNYKHGKRVGIHAKYKKRGYKRP